MISITNQNSPQNLYSTPELDTARLYIYTCVEIHETLPPHERPCPSSDLGHPTGIAWRNSPLLTGAHSFLLLAMSFQSMHPDIIAT